MNVLYELEVVNLSLSLGLKLLHAFVSSDISNTIPMDGHSHEGNPISPLSYIGPHQENLCIVQ